MPPRRCGCWRARTDLRIDDPRLVEVARLTGADVPVCLASHACVMTGVGETLSPLGLPKMPCVMVNPRVAVATKDVFAALGLRNGELLVGAADVLAGRRLAGRRRLARRLGRGAGGRRQRSRSAGDAHPAGDRRGALGAARHATACWLARMSGSGATCFAIYREHRRGAARRAEDPARSSRVVGACGRC